MRRVIKRQRTIVGRLLRDIDRKATPEQMAQLAETMYPARRLKEQKTNSKNKLYSSHAPEVECISKGKARQPYEFDVKVSFAVTAHKGLIVGGRSFSGNPYDGDTLAEQLEQTAILTDTPAKTPLVDLGYREWEVDGIRNFHRGKLKRMSQAVEPSIRHLKADHRMRRNFLKGALGDAMNPILAAAGFNICWLMRWLVVFWGWILSAVLRLLDQGGTDARSNTAPAAAITDVPGCREVVIDGVDGLMVPPRDATALVDAIERLATDPALCQRLGEAARRKAQAEFDERIVIERTMAVYEELIS